MNYTLHQLKVFLKISETKSITKAADELHLTQPAVSIQLKNFQDQFNLPLTEVVGRKLFITDFGKEVATSAEKILNEVYAINYKTTSFHGQLSGKLKISSVSTGKYVIPYFLSNFLKQHNEVELNLDVTNKVKVIESMENNEVDFALVSILPENMKVEKVDLMENKLYLISNAEMKFKNALNDKKIFETLPLIFREEGSGTRYTMEKYFNQNKLNIRKKMELTSNEAVKQAVLSGLGCSVMPLIGIRSELTHGELQIIPVKGLPIKSKWQLIWLKNKSFSLAASAFLDYIRKEKNQVIDQKFKWCDDY
jgi:DNA-binding transcriptional LysR family regulator